MDSLNCTTAAPTLASRRHVNLRALTTLMVVMVTILCLCVVAFADESEGITDLGTAINTGTLQIYTLIQTIATGIAVVFFGIRALGLMGGGQKGMETFIRNVAYLALALVVIWGAPIIVRTLKGWFGDLAGDTSDIFGS